MDSVNIGTDSKKDYWARQDICDLYEFIMYSIVSGIMTITGIIANVTSLYFFWRGVAKTSTTYQLQCLAAVDATMLFLWYILMIMKVNLNYFQINNLYTQIIQPVVYFCLDAFSHVPFVSGIWLTIYIAVSRYLAICKPFSDVHHHNMKHGKKCVALVIVLSFLFNLPHFFQYKLVSYEKDGVVYFQTNYSSFHDHELFYPVYRHYMTGVFVRFLPMVVLCIVVVKMLIKLRKGVEARSHMHVVNAPQTNITAILLTILIALIVSHTPGIVYIILVATVHPSRECGSVRFYALPITDACAVANCAINGFIYFAMNKQFRWVLLSCFGCRRNNRNDVNEMAQL